MLMRSLLAATAVGFSLFVAPVAATSAAVPRQAAVVHKACSASVSVLHPKARSNETIRVSNIGSGITVIAKAKYKTTVTTRTANSTKAGTAAVLFSVGRPTKGYKVVVNVTATKQNITWACSTSFVPS